MTIDIRAALRRSLPATMRLRVLSAAGAVNRRVRRVSFEPAERSAAPVSDVFGLDRGTPVDRYYIERFLAEHARDVRGRVLEIGDARYTARFGEGVTRSDVLDIRPDVPEATLCGDLGTGDGIPSGAFDCILCCQTLQYVYDVTSAIRHLHRALVPGGVLLATVPGISRIAREEMDLWGDYWRFTTASGRRLLAESFPEEGTVVRAYGNVLSSSAFLYGLCTQELRREELDHEDVDFQLVVGLRAAKV